MDRQEALEILKEEQQNYEQQINKHQKELKEAQTKYAEVADLINKEENAIRRQKALNRYTTDELIHALLERKTESKHFTTCMFNEIVVGNGEYMRLAAPPKSGVRHIISFIEVEWDKEEKV